jgi:ribosome biogenesis GTPase
MTRLEEYGFSARYAAVSGETPELTPGRVLLQERGAYRIVTETGEHAAEVSGRFRMEAQTPEAYPAVGDFVMADPVPVGERTMIRRLLPRKSVFLRRAAGTARTEQVVAANIDTVFLCMALDGNFNLRRLERYLSIAWDSGAQPAVVLTKADLCAELPGKLADAQSAACGTDVLAVSTLAGEGFPEIRARLMPGRTAAFLGSSGVGKSTLINRLLGENRLETGAVSADGRGRHTTTHRELLLLPDGGLVIDTPGMRELGLWDAAEGVERTFADVEALTGACRFRDCTHRGEPGCAVSAALADGTLAPERWQSYLKLKTENAYAADSEAYLASKREKFKKIAKQNHNR